jgi:hypothetical protein
MKHIYKLFSILLLTFVVTVSYSQQYIELGDLVNKSSISGTEKIPVSGASNPSITPNLLKDFIGTWQTWTPTHGGFSADPTVVAKYCLIGKLLFLSINTTVAGTSNATSYSLTLPPGFVSATGRSQIFVSGIGTNNSAGLTTPVRVTASSGSGTLTLQINPTGNTWTASGTKSASFNGFIEID